MSNEHTKNIPVHPSWMEIDLDALAHNYGLVRTIVGEGTHIIPSVKGNAYGMGIAECARVLQRLGAYAVATGSFEDAMAIRKAGIDVKIHMFAGYLPEAVDQLLENDLTPTVYDIEMARAVSQAASKPVSVFVKVDSGLARLGVPVDEAFELIQEIAALPRLSVEGVFTHLPFNDASGREWAVTQAKEFETLIARVKKAGIPIEVSQVVASAGAVSGMTSTCNMICVGHLIFGGLNRVTPDLGDLSDFRPVLSALRSRLIHVERHKADKSIGTGGKQSLKAGSVTGVIPIGSYDGYQAAGQGKTAFAIVGDARVPVLGVSQEYIALDLSKVDTPKVGDEVTMLGKADGGDITISELAGWWNTTPLSVLMLLNQRYPYIYSGGKT